MSKKKGPRCMGRHGDKARVKRLCVEEIFNLMSRLFIIVTCKGSAWSPALMLGVGLGSTSTK